MPSWDHILPNDVSSNIHFISPYYNLKSMILPSLLTIPFNFSMFFFPRKRKYPDSIKKLLYLKIMMFKLTVKLSYFLCYLFMRVYYPSQ